MEFILVELIDIGDLLEKCWVDLWVYQDIQWLYI
jgi:hypothetical protein